MSFKNSEKSKFLAAPKMFKIFDFAKTGVRCLLKIQRILLQLLIALAQRTCCTTTNIRAVFVLHSKTHVFEAKL